MYALHYLATKGKVTEYCKKNIHGKLRNKIVISSSNSLTPSLPCSDNIGDMKTWEILENKEYKKMQRD